MESHHRCIRWSTACAGPHYQFRMKIVRGEGVPQSHGSSTTTGIPGFWLKVLQAHPEIEVCTHSSVMAIITCMIRVAFLLKICYMSIQDRISGKDAMVLQHLVGIIGSRLKPAQGNTKAYGFALKFYFTPNDFFTEEELSLDVTFADEDQTIVKGIKGTRISWTSPGVRCIVALKTCFSMHPVGTCQIELRMAPSSIQGRTQLSN